MKETHLQSPGVVNLNEFMTLLHIKSIWPFRNALSFLSFWILKATRPSPTSQFFPWTSLPFPSLCCPAPMSLDLLEFLFAYTIFPENLCPVMDKFLEIKDKLWYTCISLVWFSKQCDTSVIQILYLMVLFFLSL